jgi:hypothetical protein
MQLQSGQSILALSKALVAVLAPFSSANGNIQTLTPVPHGFEPLTWSLWMMVVADQAVENFIDG